MTEEENAYSVSNSTLPAAGIISIAKLARYLKTNDSTLIAGLTNLGIPYIKISRFHKHWLVRFEDIRASKE